MKKLLLLAVCCLCLCGCGKKASNDFQATQFKWNEESYSPYVVGTIKNNSSKTCDYIYIKLKFKNGSLEEEDGCVYNKTKIKPGDVIDLECIYTGALDNITEYNITVTNVECHSF